MIESKDHTALYPSGYNRFVTSVKTMSDETYNHTRKWKTNTLVQIAYQSDKIRADIYADSQFYQFLQSTHNFELTLYADSQFSVASLP